MVKVDVYYNYSYSIQVKDLDPAKQDKNRFNDTVSYTIFSQKFYTKEPPEIYFEYQPYCISEKGEAVQYKADDYFLFDNHVDGCRLYLYKPYRDQMNAGAAGMAGGTANAGAVPVTTVNNTSAATISLIFGILGCLTGLLVPIAGLCCGVLAVMRGRLGLGSTKAKMAKAGRILGIIACVLSIVMWVLNIILAVL